MAHRFERDEEGELAARSRFALQPDLAAHALHQSARDGQTQSHSFLALSARKAEEIVEHFQVKFGRNPRPGVGHADFHRVGKVNVCRRRSAAEGWAAARRSHMCGSACSQTVPPCGVNLKEFSSRLEITRSSFGESKGKNWQLFVCQKIKRQSFFLKAVRPQAAHFRQAIVDVARLELHAQAASLECAVGQKILDELLQALAAGLHVAKNFALAVAQWAQFFAVQ